jgi:hypothetical protein
MKNINDFSWKGLIALAGFSATYLILSTSDYNTNMKDGEFNQPFNDKMITQEGYSDSSQIAYEDSLRFNNEFY